MSLTSKHFVFSDLYRKKNFAQELMTPCPSVSTALNIGISISTIFIYKKKKKKKYLNLDYSIYST